MVAKVRRLSRVGWVVLAVAAAGCAATTTTSGAPSVGSTRALGGVSVDDDAFLEDLAKRSFLFFWEQADAGTGIVRDRAGTDGGPSANESAREVGSIASIGFGLSGLCIAADRGWLPREQAIDRTRRTLRFFAGRIEQEHGWFYHFINLRSEGIRTVRYGVAGRQAMQTRPRGQTI